MSLCRFSRWRILGFRGPIMGSLKSPCTTSYRSSIETIAVVNCLVFWENRVLAFWRFWVLYGENRQKSENWATLTPRSSATVRRTKKLSGPQKLPGPWTTTWSKQYLSAVHPMTCSLLGVCLTDFDRSSTFRFSGSGIRTMIRSGLKSWSVRPCPDICRQVKFHPNPCTRFWVILLRDRQTDRGQSHIPPLFAGSNYNGILTNTASFRMTLSDLAKYSTTRSIARSLCDSRAFCSFTLSLCYHFMTGINNTQGLLIN